MEPYAIVTDYKNTTPDASLRWSYLYAYRNGCSVWGYAPTLDAALARLVSLEALCS